MFHYIHEIHKIIPTVETIEWIFFEAGHGKGALDGMGVVVKRCADQAVGHGRDISNFQDSMGVIKKIFYGKDGIKIYEIIEKYIEKEISSTVIVVLLFLLRGQ